MFGSQWAKIVRDLWGNKTRTILAVLSIALGVAATGTLIGAREPILQNMLDGYAAINPASAVVLAEPFGQAMVEAVSETPGVGQVAGRRSFQLRLRLGGDQWRELLLYALPDYQDQHIDLVKPQAGAWPPPPGEVLLERASLDYLGLRIGDVLALEMPDGTRHQVRLAGSAHDPNHIPVSVSGLPIGYVSFETLEQLGDPLGGAMNQLHILVAEGGSDRSQVEQVASAVRTTVERHGGRSLFTWVPEPGQPFTYPATSTMLLLLSVTGVVMLLMGALLVVNTVSAMLTQQVRQIGVMKAVGGQVRHLLAMYLGMAALFGLVGLVIAIPVSLLGAGALIQYAVETVNFDVLSVSVPPGMLALEVVMALLVPVLAALVPVLGAARISVREAISSYGLGNVAFGQSVADRLLERVRGLPRPVLLSLRNGFRRKARLLMTLAALILGGTFFIAVLSVSESLALTTDNEFRYMRYHVQAGFAAPVPTEAAIDTTLGVRGVAQAESWATWTAHRVRADGTESGSLTVIAPPAGTEMIEPLLLDGRWVLPGEERAIVLGTDVARSEPDLGVGDEVELKIAGNLTTWRVVGLARTRMFITGAPVGPALYTTAEALDQVLGETGKTTSLRVAAERHDPAFQEQVANDVLEALKEAGFPVSSVQTIEFERARRDAGSNIILGFLLLMAGLLAVVGGLGLAGTMSMNVLERTRELGVMRAIGASRRAVAQMVLAEGLVVALIAWSLAALLSIPASQWLNELVGRELMRQPLSYAFSVSGAALWLALAVGLTLLASALPALRATRLSVREALAYE